MVKYPQDTPLRQALKDGFTYALTGLWIVSPQNVRDLIMSADSDDFIYRTCRNGQLFGYASDGLFINVNSLAEVQKARRRLGTLE